MEEKLVDDLISSADLFENVDKLACVLRERLEDMLVSQTDFLPKVSANFMIENKNDSPQAAMSALQKIEVGDCKRCKLCVGRSQVVFGVGSSTADIVFVGEAPGAEEDRLGEPFVGRSGKLLTKMIEAMGLSREEIYICNVVKCRPPLNRNPEADEVMACEPFLKKQLAIIKPKVIVTLGRYASQCLVKSADKMSELRGKWQVYENIPLMPTYHPAYLLRSPSKKKDTWEDLQKILVKL